MMKRAQVVGIGLGLVASLAVAASASASGWLPTQQMVSVAGAPAASQEVIAVTGRGNAIAAWTDFDGTDHQVLLSRLYPGGAWYPPNAVSLRTADAQFPGIAADAAGHILVAWTEAGRLRARDYFYDGSFRDPDLGPASVARPAVALNAAGDAVAVWLAPDGIRAAHRALNGPWMPSEKIADATAASDLSVGIDASRNATALWRDSGEVVRSARLLNGDWQPAQDVSAAADEIADPKVKVGETGSPVAIWTRINGGVHSVQAAVTGNDGQWRAPETIAGPAADEPDVATDAAGDAFAMWHQYVPGAYSPDQVHLGWRPVGGTWQFRDQPQEPGVNDAPIVAANASGFTLAAWSIRGGSLAGSMWGPWNGGGGVTGTGSSPLTELGLDAQGSGTGIGTKDVAGKAAVFSVTFDGAAPQVNSVSVPNEATVGQPVTLSMQASDDWSGVGELSWQFGDGTPATIGASVTHTWHTPGMFSWTILAYDKAGNLATRNGVINIAKPTPTPTPTPSATPTAIPTVAPSPTPTPAPPAAPVAVAVPSVSGLALSHEWFRSSTAISYTLSLPATVVFRVERQESGRSVGGRCVAPAKRYRKRASCTRFVNAQRSFVRARAAGTDRLTFRAGPLKPGRYRLTVSAGTSQSVLFRVLHR